MRRAGHTSFAFDREVEPADQFLAASPALALSPGARFRNYTGAGTFLLEVLMPKQLLSSRQLAFDRQGGHCFYCGFPMWLSGAGHPPRLRCTAEHLVPRSQGGTDRPGNIVAACAHCNGTRHKRKCPPEPAKYRDDVMRRIKQGRWHPAWVHRRSPVEGPDDKAARAGALQSPVHFQDLSRLRRPP